MMQEEFGDNIMQSPESERRELKKRLSNPRQAQAMRKNVSVLLYNLCRYHNKIVIKIFKHLM
jgi:hypothetical protein